MQGIYWLLTIPHHAFVPYLPPGVAYIRGQLERGENTGYLHWQLSLFYPRNNELVSSRNYWDQNVTQSLVARLRRPIMSGKKIQELTELHLNWDDCLLNGIVKKIGTPSRVMQNVDGWMISRVISWYAITEYQANPSR